MILDLGLLLLILCRLLNSVSLAGSDNLLVGVECKGKHSNVILTTQSKNTLYYVCVTRFGYNVSIVVNQFPWHFVNPRTDYKVAWTSVKRDSSSQFL